MISVRAILAPLAFLCLLAFSAGTATSAPQAPDAAAPAAAPAIPAKIAIAAGFASLDEGVRCESRQENLYLTVQNEGVSDLEIRGIELLAPSDIELCRRSGTIVVAAGRNAIIALPVGTRETPRPGIVPLLVAVDLAADIGGSERTDRLLASDKIELRIPGLSEVLKLIGVPTLFLLPGVLVLGAFFLVHPLESRRLAPNSISFWIVAVTISLGLSWLYTRAMGLAGYERDLTERFNLADVLRIWTASVILGGIAGAIARKVKRDNIAAEARAAAARILHRTDDPLTLLDRLGPLGIEWPPTWYRTDGREGFLIEPGGGQPRWLVPQATLRDRPADVPEKEWKAAGRALSELRTAASAADLAKGLRSEAVKPLLPLIWKDAAKPEPLDEKAVLDQPTRRNFIEPN